MTITQKLLAYQYPACAEQMGGMRQKLREALGPYLATEDEVNNVVLAVCEACMNIIQHAYGPSDRGDILLEVETTTGKEDSRQGGKTVRNLVFRLTDYAKHKSSAIEMRSRPLDEIRPGGLGCHIIKQVMDEVVLLDNPGFSGNVLELRKRLCPVIGQKQQ